MARQEAVESRHANTLREMGFEQIDKKTSLRIRESCYKGLTRNQRRQLRRQKYRPWYTAADEVTFATDETGQSWVSKGKIDLAPLGFDNKSDEYQADLRAFRNSNPRFN